MNGLKYIRIRCNLSLNELADAIGVTRQALSAWENGKQSIPEQRKKQLEDFVGIESSYFGEITEEEKEALLDKGMYCYEKNGSETYRYKPPEGFEDRDRQEIFYYGDRKISLDEEYALAIKRKKQVLKEIESIIHWIDNPDILESKTMCINRGCSVYETINTFMKKMKSLPGYLRITFFYELVDVWAAMLYAYGLFGDRELHYHDGTEDYYGEDGAWILELSEKIKEHWDMMRNALEHYRKRPLNPPEKTEPLDAEPAEDTLSHRSAGSMIVIKSKR